MTRTVLAVSVAVGVAIGGFAPSHDEKTEVKRKVVSSKYAGLIEAMYSRPAASSAE